MKSEKEPPRGYPNYARTPIGQLKKSRKGKHHALLGRIMEDLREAVPGFAVCIPMASIAGVSVLNLRSAIVRAAAKENIGVSTSSDDKQFYVWKANSHPEKIALRIRVIPLAAVPISKVPKKEN